MSHTMSEGVRQGQHLDQSYICIPKKNTPEKNGLAIIKSNTSTSMLEGLL